MELGRLDFYTEELVGAKEGLERAAHQFQRNLDTERGVRAKELMRR